MTDMDAKYNNEELSLDNKEPCSSFSTLDYTEDAPSNEKKRVLSRENLCQDDSKSLESLLEENTIKISGRPEKGTKYNRISRLHQISVQRLTKPFIQANSILLTPVLTDVSVSLRKALNVVYQKLEWMAPDLSFQPSQKDLHCRGCFSWDFDTCTFEGQICCFSISSDVTHYFYQLRRTSYGGREPFDMLLRVVASVLKHKGYAKEYADGLKIHPMLTIDDDERDKSTILTLDDDYLDKSSMTTPDIVSCSRSSLSSLESDYVMKLSSQLAKRLYPLSNETLRIMAKLCAISKENCEMLFESQELGRELVRILNDSIEPSLCLNALKLIEFGASAPRDPFKAIARIMIMNCALKPSTVKWTHSQAIENAALGAMNVLMQRLETKEREENFQVIEKILSGKISEKLLHKAKKVCSRK